MVICIKIQTAIQNCMDRVGIVVSQCFDLIDFILLTHVTSLIPLLKLRINSMNDVWNSEFIIAII